MTEIKELISVAIELDEKETCPFCGKAPHEFDKKEEGAVASDEVVSSPSSLGCPSIPGSGVGKWTKAAHHLICAKQCYAIIKPLVRMGSLDGYDINGSNNGMPLPTFKNKYDGLVNGVMQNENFGRLDESEKERIAEWVMDVTKAQWHVSHHSFEQQIDWDIDETFYKFGMPHEASYDLQVLADLFEIYEAYISSDEKYCEEDEESDSDLTADLDFLSDYIKSEIEMFKAGKPWDSVPYFVSPRAVTYASKKKNGLG